MAVGATPGSGFPSGPRKGASPITKISGWPGTWQNGPHIDPASAIELGRLLGPRTFVKLAAVTPAAHKTVLASMIAVLRSGGPPPYRHRPPSHSASTGPPAESASSAFSESSGSKGVRTRGAPSRQDTGFFRPDRTKVVFQRVIRDLTEGPRELDPVGPAPTTTKVSHARRFSGSRSFSAASNA